MCFYDDIAARSACEAFLERHFDVINLSKIPVRKTPKIRNEPLIWRYFVAPLPQAGRQSARRAEFTARCVIRINTQISGAYVFPAGRIWASSRRSAFPRMWATSTAWRITRGLLLDGPRPLSDEHPGWWGGAHPFALLDYSIVHNGEISSYDANRRFIEMFGYQCTLLTDTEVITYMVDYLHRRLGLTLEEVAGVIAAPFWSTIERMPEEERKRQTYLRTMFSSLLITGPFSILLGFEGRHDGLERPPQAAPMVVAEKGSRVYVGSENAPSARWSPRRKRVFAPRGGEPVIVTLSEEGRRAICR